MKTNLKSCFNCSITINFGPAERARPRSSRSRSSGRLAAILFSRRSECIRPDRKTAASFDLAAVAVVVATAPQRTNQIGYLIRGRFVGLGTAELNSSSRSRFASPTGAVAPVGWSRQRAVGWLLLKLPVILTNRIYKFKVILAYYVISLISKFVCFTLRSNVIVGFPY